MQRTLQEVSVRLNHLASYIPDHIDSQKLSEEQFGLLRYIDAIEEEWVVDPLKREQLSCIQWNDSTEDE